MPVRIFWECGVPQTVNDREPSLLEQCGLASGLLVEEQIEAARAGPAPAARSPWRRRPVTDQELADRLVEMELLNPWQAKQLLDGRTKFTLGPYLTVDLLGQGGMGQVFKARHAETGQIVAVKVLPLDKSTPEAIAGFQREIEAIERLKHPKLVAALDAGAGRKRPLPRHRVRARQGPAAAGPRRRAAGDGRGRTDRLPGRRRARICARPRLRPPRREAGKRAGRARRPGEAFRPWPGRTGGRRR